MQSRHKPCDHCGTPLTDEAPVQIDNKLQHHLTNRAGHTFVVRCYASAAHAAPAGPATDEHTWFSGHTWRRLFCKQCNHHVGWQFRSTSRVFCALIDAG